MPGVLQNILISLGTSAVVGFFTFAFGMKSGKNQADRAKVQAIYTKLLEEFESIGKNLDSCPREWSDYPRKKKQHTKVAVTPLKEVLDNGEYVFIAEKQLNELRKLEKDALSYGWDVLMLIRKIPLILDRHPELFEKQGKYLGGKPSNRPTVYNMKDDAAQGTFQYANIYDFLDEQELVSKLEDGITLVFSDGRSPEHVDVTIIPRLLNVLPAEFASVVNKELMVNEGGNSLLAKKDALKQRLDEQVKLLRKQARDPFPFWKTFGAAIRDIGKAN